MTEPDVHMDGSVMPDDAWLERLLREDASQQRHIDDAGFSRRVMAALPRRRKPVSSWLVPAMTVLGCLLTGVFTPAGEDMVRGLLRLTDFQHFHFSNLLVLAPVAALYFCGFMTVKEP